MGTPVIISFSRTYNFAIAAAATVALALWAIARSRNFQRLGWSVAAGAALGLVALARTMNLALLPAIAVACLVAVCGVAYDREGRRLGYGGGYYDRLLPLLSPRAARVAGAFDVQIVDRVPTGPNDVTIDAVVTESRALSMPR